MGVPVNLLRALVNAAFVVIVIAWAKFDNTLHGYNPLSLSSGMAIAAAYGIGYFQGGRKPHGTLPQMRLAWYSVPLLTIIALVGGVLLEVYRGGAHIKFVSLHIVVGLCLALAFAAQATLAYRASEIAKEFERRERQVPSVNG